MALSSIFAVTIRRKHAFPSIRCIATNTPIQKSVSWTLQDGKTRTQHLLSHHTFDSGLFPIDAVVVDDTTRASAAARHVKNGKALVYEGDYHCARQLLSALKRRVVRQNPQDEELSITKQWNRQRWTNRERARFLNMLLLEVDSDHSLRSYRRAPDVSEILGPLFGDQRRSYLVPLREVMGMIGAHEWRKRGVFIPQMEEYIYPHYGVFVPTRREYLDLILQAPIPLENGVMMDIGIGTGVISAVMLLKGKVSRIIGTDVNSNAIECARDNMERLGLSDQVELVQTNIFPSSLTKADVIVCNPPWLPGEVESLLDRAVYDEDSSFIQGFLSKARGYLRNDRSEVWLILSNMAELLGLRSRQELLQIVDKGNLQVIDSLQTRPVHAKARNLKHVDEYPAVAAARASEITTLYRLRGKM